MPALWLLLVALVVTGAGVAKKTPVPDAVIWCVLGFAVAFVPGFPAVRFDPNIALFLFLPPLVYSSAVELPWPEFRDNLRPIGMLAIGLVMITTVATAAVAHSLMGMSWPVAVVLGAVISPTDTVAAGAVASRVGLPRRLVAILEGEGLVNDAVSLTILRIALTAAAGGAFSLGKGVERFLAILILEPLYGWLLGIGVARLRARITDARMEIAVSLLTPFAAYLLPEHLGGSGILATVAAGMYIGEQRPTLVPAGTRLHATSFWGMIIFLLNGTLFLTAGIELRRVIVSNSTSGLRVIWWGVAIAATITAVRFAWSAAHKYGMRALRLAFGWERHRTPARQMVVVACAGMRGPISLAAALSIPASLNGAPFPDFELVLFTTAVVIVVTLVVQGTALGPLVQALGVSKDADRDRKELEEQRIFGQEQAARAALDQLFTLQNEGSVSPDVAQRLGQIYKDRLAEARAEETGEKDKRKGAEIRSQLLAAERARVLQLRNEGRISDHALGFLERKLDLSETLLD